MTEEMPKMSPIWHEIIPENAIFDAPDEPTREQTQTAGAFSTPAQNNRRFVLLSIHEHRRKTILLKALHRLLSARRGSPQPEKSNSPFRTQLIFPLWIPQSEHRKTFISRRGHSPGKRIRCIFASKYRFFERKTAPESRISEPPEAPDRPASATHPDNSASPELRRRVGPVEARTAEIGDPFACPDVGFGNGPLLGTSANRDSEPNNSSTHGANLYPGTGRCQVRSLADIRAARHYTSEVFDLKPTRGCD
jgi:hypothetical protein